MNEIPSAGPEREAYIISVMQGVKREGDRALNVQGRDRDKSKSWGWIELDKPLWNWDQFDFRLYEPEVVEYAKGYRSGVSEFYESLSDCKEDGVIGCTHYVKRTTGGGRTIPDYESIPLERGE